MKQAFEGLYVMLAKVQSGLEQAQDQLNSIEERLESIDKRLHLFEKTGQSNNRFLQGVSRLGKELTQS